MDWLPERLREEWRDLVDARTNIHHDLCGAASFDEPDGDGEDELGPRATGCSCATARIIGEMDAALDAARLVA